MSEGIFFLLSFGSTLLMVRFFRAIQIQRHPSPATGSRGVLEGLWWGMGLLVLLPLITQEGIAKLSPLVPIALALLLAALWYKGGLKAPFMLPAGDLVHTLSRLVERLAARIRRHKNPPPAASLKKVLLRLPGAQIERLFGYGVVWMGLFWVLVLLLGR
jgi:hypothetical protein